MRKLLLVMILALSVTCAAEDVSLTWDASTSEGVEGYNVYRSGVSGSGYVKLNTELISGLTYIDTTAEEGQTYFYVVTSMRNGIESLDSVDASQRMSNEYVEEVPWTTAPLPPSNLRNTQQGANNTLTWDPVQRADRYSIDFADDPSSWTLQAVVSATSYEFKAHPNGSPKLLGVRAMVDGVWSERSVIPR